jgi:hypothetical protein
MTPVCKIAAAVSECESEPTGNYAWRVGLYDDVRALLDENTCSGAIDASCEFARRMVPALERAVDHPRHDRGPDNVPLDADR